MQFVGQTGRALKKRFGEHYRRMNKRKKLIIFCIGTLNVKATLLLIFWFSQWKKITYDANSTSRFKIIKRHETELKWIILLQTPYPLGFNDNTYMSAQYVCLRNTAHSSFRCLLNLKNITKHHKTCFQSPLNF